MASSRSRWPVLKKYEGESLRRVAMPLGGIGTGTVSLGGRGNLRDWEIMNRPGKGFTPSCQSKIGGIEPFFALFTKAVGGRRTLHALEGELDTLEYEGSHGSGAGNHGMPRFRRCSFEAAYPLAQVTLSDPGVPVAVRLEAFNPLIPGDPERSGIPVVLFRFVLRNRTHSPVQAAVCGSLPNFIGIDGSQTALQWGRVPLHTGASKNRNRYREGSRVRGFLMDSRGVDPGSEAWGTLALVTPAHSGVSHRTALDVQHWSGLLTDFGEDFGRDGRLHEGRKSDSDTPLAALAVRTQLGPRAEKTVSFILAWHFPNRVTWNGTSKCPPKRGWIGNYYATRYRNAWEVAEQTTAQATTLEADTVRFVKAFCDSDLPDTIKESSLFNISTLRTQTCFRTPDGRFFGFEGVHDSQGCCHGSCTHVWNYEQATAFLFGGLACTMRDTEFMHALRDDGMMSFRTNLPLTYAAEMTCAAADGQLGCIMKLYRDWQLSGDDEMLKRLWPKARKSLEYCWIPGGWDADRDGVMEGCQHNTMDIEYYGPNPQMGAWYLGALRAAEEMATHLGKGKGMRAGACLEFARECRRLFEQGREWLDTHLFNGDYYEHEIRPPRNPKTIPAGQRIGPVSRNLKSPDWQLGSGCLVDQLVGQTMAHVCGLGYLLRPDHVRKTLRSIARFNRRKGFHDHFNAARSFVLGDETALLMATYPRGRQPDRPFFYSTEVMTGFEHVAAAHMVYEGQTREGLRVIRDIRERYDGYKRNPFDEAECGHHYARAMASWAAVTAWTGFHYSGVSKSISFAAKPGRWFWSNGYAWGTCRLTRKGDGWTVSLDSLFGHVPLRTIRIGKHGTVTFSKERVLRPGRRLRAGVKASG